MAVEERIAVVEQIVRDLKEDFRQTSNRVGNDREWKGKVIVTLQDLVMDVKELKKDTLEDSKKTNARVTSLQVKVTALAAGVSLVLKVLPLPSINLGQVIDSAQEVLLALWISGISGGLG